MTDDAPLPVLLDELTPVARRHLYSSCYRRALLFISAQCAVMVPLYLFAGWWCVCGGDKSGTTRIAVSSVALVLMSFVTGYLLVAAYVRQILEARPGFVRFMLVRDALTR